MDWPSNWTLNWSSFSWSKNQPHLEYIQIIDPILEYSSKHQHQKKGTRKKMNQNGKIREKLQMKFYFD